jgi:serine/threonine protein kinase
LQKSETWKARHGVVEIICPNKTQLRDYDFQVIIGQGGCGSVHRAIHKESKITYAIKQYDKSKLIQDANALESVKREIRVMQAINHQGIMNFHDAIDSGAKISMVVEYIPGCNLYQFIRKMPGSRITDNATLKTIFRQVVEAVAYLHSMGVVHRDLKLENVLIDKQTLRTKIIDFGFSTRVADVNTSRLSYSCGTPIYMCPDMA